MSEKANCVAIFPQVVHAHIVERRAQHAFLLATVIAKLIYCNWNSGIDQLLTTVHSQ